MTKRNRLNLTLTASRLSQLKRLRDRYHAKSYCRVIYDILAAIDRVAVESIKAGASDASTVEADIKEMFDRYTNGDDDHGARPSVHQTY